MKRRSLAVPLLLSAEKAIRKTSWFRGFCFSATLILAFSAAAHPQSAISTGSISGQVTDPSGRPVAGATVTATDVATNASRIGETNGTGFYSFPSLQVGTYTVTVADSGFKTTRMQNIVVQVGQSMAANATLEIGAATETVTVTGEAPLVETTEASVSTVVNETLIQNLPLSARRYTDFVLLTPNANTDGEFGLVSIGGQQGGLRLRQRKRFELLHGRRRHREQQLLRRGSRTHPRSLRFRRTVDSGISSGRQSL